MLIYKISSYENNELMSLEVYPEDVAEFLREELPKDIKITVETVEMSENDLKAHVNNLLQHS